VESHWKSLSGFSCECILWSEAVDKS